MDYLKELAGKRIHDHLDQKTAKLRCKWVPGPIIVGAGPSGLAAAACLKQRGIPSLILERAACLASLWQQKTYDRLHLHLPKQFCELPFMPFPKNFPAYPTKQQFVAYLKAYADRFEIKPVFNETVVSAKFDQVRAFWRVRTKSLKIEEAEYASKWLIVATGENAESVVPQIEGMNEFCGTMVHTSAYKSGDMFRGKSVLVVGCGNSGMEVCLDLCNYNARPSLVVRDSVFRYGKLKNDMEVMSYRRGKYDRTYTSFRDSSEVHVLPQEMLGRSTFGLSMWLLKWLPMRLVDLFLLLISRMILGDTAQFGLNRPKLGPLELKNKSGKTPVLDVGTLAKIKTGNIKVYKAIKRLTNHAVEFVDGKVEKFDAIILATGYKSNVPSWLKGSDMFSEKDGLPREPFPEGWKGRCGLYAVGFTKRGLLGTSIDARKIAEDIRL